MESSLILSLVHPMMTPKMNEIHFQPFSKQELCHALFYICPLQAPGPDGFLARLFQRNYTLLKEDIIHVVKVLFESGCMSDG